MGHNRVLWGPESFLERATSVQFGFLLTQLELGETFVRLAARTDDTEHQRNFIRDTHKIIYTVRRFLPACALDASAHEELEQKLHSLGSALDALASGA